MRCVRPILTIVSHSLDLRSKSSRRTRKPGISPSRTSYAVATDMAVGKTSLELCGECKKKVRVSLVETVTAVVHYVNSHERGGQRRGGFVHQKTHLAHVHVVVWVHRRFASQNRTHHLARAV